MDKKFVKNELPSDFCSGSHRYKTKKGEISLLYPCFATMQLFEIYVLRCDDDVDAPDDVERFDSLKEAEVRIVELIGKD